MRYNKTKVFACTSFKGGSGRTVATANIAFQLAKQFRVGIIDFDTEAGGLHYLFNYGDPGDKLAVQHFMMNELDHMNATNKEKPDFDNQDVFITQLCIDINKRDVDLRDNTEMKGQLYLIQSVLDANLTAMVDTTRGAFFRLNNLLQNFSTFLNLDYIFIDCRSGISNLGLPGLAYCDVALFFLRWGTQHKNGTERMIRWYAEWLRKARKTTKIFIIASTINEKFTTKENIIEYVSQFKDLGVDYSCIPELDELKKMDRIITSGDNQIHFQALANNITLIEI
jgi:cellulose biosynthesis protein BcsQ